MRHKAHAVESALISAVFWLLDGQEKRHARSMEDEVRHILRTAAQEPSERAQKLGSRIAQRFRGSGLSSDLPELRGVIATAAEFDS